MLDHKFIRENSQAVRQMIADRHVEADLDGFLSADGRFREIIDEVNTLKHEKNVVSRDIAKERGIQEDG